MECKSKKTLLLILLTAFVLFTFFTNDCIFSFLSAMASQSLSHNPLGRWVRTSPSSTFVVTASAGSTSNVFAAVSAPSFPEINVNQLTPTTIQQFNTVLGDDNLSYKMFIGSDGKTYLNVWVDGSGSRDVYEWNPTTSSWIFSATLSSNTLVKGAEEPRTPATSRYTTWDEYSGTAR